MSYLLEFDPVGQLPDNWKPNEQHTISPVNGESWRFFKPKYGPFFLSDLEIRHLKPDGSWERLVAGTHYTLGYVYLDMKEHILQPVYTVVQLLDDNVAGEVQIDYHSVGGESTDIVHDLVIEGAAVLLEPKKYTLEDIVDMPDRLPPVDHDVLTDHVFGWNKVTEAIWAICYAIAGDPFIEHNHNVNSITGLIDLLDTKSSADMSHKAGIHNAQRILNHTGTVGLTIPKCVNNTVVRGTVGIIENNQINIINFSGEVHGAANITVPNQDWVSGEVEELGNSNIKNVSFTYDGSQRPVIYFGTSRVYTDTRFVLMEITWGSDATMDKRTGYTFTKETLSRGTIKETRSVFTYSEFNAGVLLPDMTWVITSDNIVRPLPAPSNVILNHGDKIRVVARNNNAKYLPSGVSGNIEDFEGETLRISKKGGVLEFSWDNDKQKWLITGCF